MGKAGRRVSRTESHCGKERPEQGNVLSVLHTCGLRHSEDDHVIRVTWQAGDIQASQKGRMEMKDWGKGKDLRSHSAEKINLNVCFE